MSNICARCNGKKLRFGKYCAKCNEIVKAEKVLNPKLKLSDIDIEYINYRMGATTGATRQTMQKIAKDEIRNNEPKYKEFIERRGKN